MMNRRAAFGALALGCAAVASALAATGQKPATDPPVAPPPLAAKPEANPGEAGVRDLLKAFSAAYNKADAVALAGLFVDDAILVDSDGEETRGAAAIAERYAAAFQDAPGVTIEARLERVRFVTPEVARADGSSRLASGSGDAAEFHKFSGLAVLQGGAWKIEEVRDYPMPVEDVTPYERLKELEWMVGDWVDEDADNKVSSRIRWADNRSYLVRTYEVELQGQKASSGTMFIGWDPQTGQIKSWLFDSEGGHGEGLWTRTADNRWVVKAQGVLRDGRPTSATQTHTVVNKDAVKTSSVDRILGGQVAPDVPEILMVRKPPQPSAEAAPAPAPAPRPTPVAPK